MSEQYEVGDGEGVLETAVRIKLALDMALIKTNRLEMRVTKPEWQDIIFRMRLLAIHGPDGPGLDALDVTFQGIKIRNPNAQAA